MVCLAAISAFASDLADDWVFGRHVEDVEEACSAGRAPSVELVRCLTSAACGCRIGADDLGSGSSELPLIG